MEIENHFHWYRRIGTLLTFILLDICFLVNTVNTNYFRGEGYRSIGYMALLLIPLYYGLIFYIRNAGFNRNFFFCDGKIIAHYRHKKVFKDEKLETINVDMSDIKNLYWSPLERTRTSAYKTNNFKGLVIDFTRQILFLPLEVICVFMKLLYYLINGFRLKYLFKNLLLITETQEILIPIKSKQDYENVKAYFDQYNIDIDRLKNTFKAEIYYVRD